MIINYDLYQIFYYVAQNRNLTAAANQLYLSQSTVSRAIQSLENELNCTLFIRSPKGMELTESGLFLFGHVKKAAAEFTLAENHLHKMHSLQEGFLRIGITEMTLQHFLLPYLKDLQKQYPGLNVSLSFETRMVNDALHNGRRDLEILTSPIIEDERLCVHNIRPVQDVLIAGDKYQKFAGRKVSIKELDHEDFILMKEETSTREYARQISDQFHIRLNAKYEVSTLSLIMTMAAQNMGIGLLPSEYLQAYEGTDLFCIDLFESLPQRQICVLYSKEYENNPVRDMFLEKIMQI